VTDWLSASAMLLAGVIVGFMFLYGMKRRQERSDLERADLEAKRDALIARLREGFDPALEREAADVLRKLDALGGVEAASQAADGGLKPAATHAALKGFAWGAASVAILVAIGWFVTQSSKPKDPFSQLQQSVVKNPDNLALRDDLAKAYLDRDNLNGVAEQTQYVLQRNPNDARALTYQALVHIAARQPEVAAAMLQRATVSDPNLLDAWVGLAWLHAERGDLPRAQSAIEEAKRRHPEESQRLDELMARLRPATPLHITLNLAKGVTPPPQGVIFITARAAGVTAGPPAAVKRLPLGSFPLDLDLTAADSMMGQPLPAKMRIEARIDSDGDPLTRDPKDPAAFVDGVAVGQSISLTLK
jgi:tetratricopeptide (TPR) repeat protein